MKNIYDRISPLVLIDLIHYCNNSLIVMLAQGFCNKTLFNTDLYIAAKLRLIQPVSANVNNTGPLTVGFFDNYSYSIDEVNAHNFSRNYVQAIKYLLPPDTRVLTIVNQDKNVEMRMFSLMPYPPLTIGIPKDYFSLRFTLISLLFLQGVVNSRRLNNAHNT